MSLSEADHRLLAIWAADCAEHVLGRFDDAHPDDDRPRRAVEAARAWARGEIAVARARTAAFAAHAAASTAADDPAACAGARAAGHAAATAHVAGHARHAAAYAVKAARAPERERSWQWQRLPERLRPAVGEGGPEM